MTSTTPPASSQDSSTSGEVEARRYLIPAFICLNASTAEEADELASNLAGDVNGALVDDGQRLWLCQSSPTFLIEAGVDLEEDDPESFAQLEELIDERQLAERQEFPPGTRFKVLAVPDQVVLDPVERN